MRMRKKPWAVGELAESEFFIKKPMEYKGRWGEAFPKAQPLHVELGCGKGGFIAELALKNRGINYLAIDVISDMLGLAKRNIEKSYGESPIDNVRITAQNIENIDAILAENDVCDRIYINFCNPWPRGKHNKRRLTHPRQLEKYRAFLRDGGEIYFKTDSAPLFHESVPYFLHSGFEISYRTDDLHNSGFDGNIETEHERMFTAEGIPTKFLIAVKKGGVEQVRAAGEEL